MRNNALFILLFSFASIIAVPGRCQQPQAKFIVKDAGDSLFLKAFRSTFDTDGNYYFETLISNKGDKFSMVTNKKKHSPVYLNSKIAIIPYKGVISDAFYSDTSHKKIYYKNKNGTKIYGPYAGRIREVLEFGRNNIAMELCVGSKSYLYINDSLVNVTDSLKQHWTCFFSENGNVLYTIYKNDHYRLYVNHQLIDSSSEPFVETSINNNKFYIYGKQEHGKFYAHTSKQKFGPFGAIDYSDLWANNDYYFRGCADSQCYVLINDKMFNGINESFDAIEDPANGNIVYKSDEQMTVEPFDADHFCFTYNQNNDNGTFLNVNGKVTHFDYPLTGLIFYDKSAGYAFYGSKIDTIGLDVTYKNINGKEKKLAPFKKGRHIPHCLTLSPNGESLYYYETADSIYLYRNDTLLCKPADKKKFLTWDYSVLPQSHAEGLEYFQGINIDGASYLVYNNTVSRKLPMIYPMYNRLDPPQKGSIMAGDISSKGFFLIIYTGPGKYLLIINNKVYKELEGIDDIFGEQSYFTDHSVIFYGLKGSSYYEYKIEY